MADYLPDSDTDFTAWMQNFITYANANLSALGLTAADLTPIQNAETSWETATAANVTAQAQAQSARQTKDDARSRQENLVRPLVAQLQASQTVTDAPRLAPEGRTVSKQPTRCIKSITVIVSAPGKAADTILIHVAFCHCCGKTQNAQSGRPRRNGKLHWQSWSRCPRHSQSPTTSRRLTGKNTKTQRSAALSPMASC